MLRFLFLMLLCIHGLIHLMGLTKAFGLADLPQLKHEISPTRGFFWGLSGLLFFIVAGLFYFRLDTWWMIAVMGVALSQYLIIQHWHDTKFGTIINLIILLWSITGIGGWILEHSAHNSISRIIPDHQVADTLRDTEKKQLPQPVKKWLMHSSTNRPDTIYNMYLRQEGEMKLSRNGPWYPFTAEQWISLGKPGYVWKVRSGQGFMQFEGLDTYSGGKGKMKIEAYSVVPVTTASGDEVNQGSMVRYAAEMIWYPFVAEHLSFVWQAETDTSATVVMTDGGKQVNATYTFNEVGLPVKINAERTYHGKEDALRDWEVTVDPRSLREFEGIRVPTEATVTWDLPEGPFTWLKIKVTSIDYNVTLPDHTRITAGKK